MWRRALLVIHFFKVCIVLWRISLNILFIRCICFTGAPVRHYICHCKWKKSTKPLESKMRQIFLEINPLCSNCARVQDIFSALQYRSFLNTFYGQPYKSPSTNWISQFTVTYTSITVYTHKTGSSIKRWRYYKKLYYIQKKIPALWL